MINNDQYCRHPYLPLFLLTARKSNSMKLCRPLKDQIEVTMFGFQIAVVCNEYFCMKGERMSILWMIVIGLLVGAMAKLLMPGHDPGGSVITMLLGIAGSVVAGFIGRSLGWYAPGEPAGFVASVLGAILLLALYRAIGRADRGRFGRAA